MFETIKKIIEKISGKKQVEVSVQENQEVVVPKSE